MRDFDVNREARKARDRTFKLGGELFEMLPGVRPEALMEYQSVNFEGDDGKESLVVIDDMFCTFLAGDGPDRYRALRERTDDPLTLADLMEVIEWFVEEQTGRPTTQPSPSQPGQPPTGTTSTANSPSEESISTPSLSAVS